MGSGRGSEYMNVFMVLWAVLVEGRFGLEWSHICWFVAKNPLPWMFPTNPVQLSKHVPV